MAFNVDPAMVGRLPSVVISSPNDADAKYNGSRPSPFGGRNHQWQWVFDVGVYTGSQQSKTCTPGLPTNGTMVVNSDQMPEYWIVSIIISSAAGTQVGVYLGPAQSGPPIRLGNGGNCKIIANGQNYLTLVNLGTQIAFGTVIAVGGDGADVVLLSPATVA
jgi:hypothetical protein